MSDGGSMLPEAEPPRQGVPRQSLGTRGRLWKAEPPSEPRHGLESNLRPRGRPRKSNKG